MTEKRFKLIYNEYQTSNGKTIKAEPYFIDTKEEYVDEVYFMIKGYPTMSDEQVVDLLNEQEETIQTQKDYIIRMGHGTIFEEMKRLKERNQRQYERLKELTDLMFKRDWKTLNDMVDEWEKEEEQLQKYGG